MKQASEHITKLVQCSLSITVLEMVILFFGFDLSKETILFFVMGIIAGAFWGATIVLAALADTFQEEE